MVSPQSDRGERGSASGVSFRFRADEVGPFKMSCKRNILALAFIAVSLSAVKSQSPQPITNFPTQGNYDPNEKLGRTLAQQKIDSQLLAAARMTSATPNGANVSRLEQDDKGRVVVDISCKVTDFLLKKIRLEGGSVVNSYPQFDSIRAYLPLKSLEAIARLDEVRTIMPAAAANFDRNIISTGRPSVEKAVTLKTGTANSGNARRKKRVRRRRRKHNKPVLKT